MSAPLTPEHEAQVRAIVAEMIGLALAGVNDRVRAEMRETVLSYVPAIADGVFAQMRKAPNPCRLDRSR